MPISLRLHAFCPILPEILNIVALLGYIQCEAPVAGGPGSDGGAAVVASSWHNHYLL